MNGRTTGEGRRRSMPWRTKCAAGASLVVVLSLATVGSSATPSFASAHLKSANGSTYCKLLATYVKKQNADNKALQTPGGAIKAMEAAYKNLKTEETIVLNVAPSALKSSYQLVFKDINVFYAELAAVGYKYQKLSKAQIAKFEALSKTMAPATTKITAYDKNVCGVKD